MYPAITPDMFIMTWRDEVICPGNASCTFTPTVIQGDSAIRYALKFTKTLTPADNGAEIACTVNPEMGHSETSEPFRVKDVCEYNLIKIFPK